MQIVIFIFGLIVGSFLNVCIYRMPRDKKFIWGRSMCPHCSEVIRWYDNIPLLSYIILRGKCRYCSGKISSLYPIVEGLTGLYFLLIWQHFIAFSASLVAIYFVFGSFLIIGSFIDIDFMIIPDRITLGGLCLGLVASALFPIMFEENTILSGFLQSLKSAFISGGVLYAIAIIGTIVFRKEAMGMGDVKLLAMIGSFIGWQKALGGIFAASFLGSFMGIIIYIFFKRQKIKDTKLPFGPFLALGSVISLLWGEFLWGWYTGLLMLK